MCHLLVHELGLACPMACPIWPNHMEFPHTMMPCWRRPAHLVALPGTHAANLYRPAQAMLQGKSSLLIADHAGSGKTLAYLAPLVQRLRAQEAAADDIEPEFRNSPRALVLTPTAELCQQVVAVAKGLAREAPSRSIAITGALSQMQRTHAPRMHARQGLCIMPVGAVSLV